jgi:hypothetical protein
MVMGSGECGGLDFIFVMGFSFVGYEFVSAYD